MQNFRKLLKAARVNKYWHENCRNINHRELVKKFNLKVFPDQGRIDGIMRKKEEKFFDFLNRKISSGREIIQNTPIDSEWLSVLYGTAKEMKKISIMIECLESEYIFASGHYRMIQYYKGHSIKHPDIGWHLIGGAKKDVLYSEKIQNAEKTLNFSTFEEFAKGVIEYLANFRGDAEIVDIWFKNRKVYVKAKNIGMVIGRGGSRIKAMQEIIGRRVIAISDKAD